MPSDARREIEEFRAMREALRRAVDPDAEVPRRDRKRSRSSRKTTPPRRDSAVHALSWHAPT